MPPNAITNRTLLRGRGRTRQRIAEVYKSHRKTGVTGRSARDQPWIPLQIRVLEHEVQSAPPGIFGKRKVGTNRTLLNGTILPVAGDRSISDQLAGSIDGKVLSDVNAAIICIKHGSFASGLKSGYGRCGMHQRQVAICSDDEVRRLAENVASTAVAPEIIGENTEALEQFEIEIDGRATA